MFSWYCPAVPDCPQAATCSGGALPFSAQALDYTTCTPLAGASVTAIGADQTPIAGASVTSANDGTFSLCAPVGIPLSALVTAAQYPPTYSAEFVVSGDGLASPQLPMFSDQVLAAIQTFIPGGVNPSAGSVAIQVEANVGSGILTTAAAGCEGLAAGWSIGLALPDGGGLPDGSYQVFYLTPSLIPDSQATGTFSIGIGFIYDIDPTLLPGFFALQATNPDAGSCAPLSADLDLTGRLFVSGGSATEGPLQLGCEVPGMFCPAVAVVATPAACPGGASVSSQAVDLLACAPFGGAVVTALDPDGVPIPGAAATGASNGAAAICVPGGSPFTLETTAASYPPNYSAEIVSLDAGAAANAFASQLLETTSQLVLDYALELSNFDTTQATIAAEVIPFGPGAFRCNRAGWSFGLTLPDGGALPDGGYQLACAAASGALLSADPTTSAYGFCLLYDIDPSAASFLTVTATNPDAGASCQLFNASMGMTGRVFVAGGGVTTFPLWLQ